MKKICLRFSAILLFGLFLISPFMTKAAVHPVLVSADGNNVTVSISLDGIEDIDGCDASKCQYWQMVFERVVPFDTTLYHRYYSSDVFPASRLSASYDFHLPAGDYSNFTLEGYATSTTGYCGWEDFSDVCPDGKRVVADERPGTKSVSDPSFMSFLFTVQDNPLTTASPEIAATSTAIASSSPETATTTLELAATSSEASASSTQFGGIPLSTFFSNIIETFTSSSAASSSLTASSSQYFVFSTPLQNISISTPAAAASTSLALAASSTATSSEISVSSTMSQDISASSSVIVTSTSTDLAATTSTIISTSTITAATTDNTSTSTADIATATSTVSQDVSASTPATTTVTPAAPQEITLPTPTTTPATPPQDTSLSVSAILLIHFPSFLIKLFYRIFSSKLF